MTFQIDVNEYRSLMRSLNGLPKEANQELRKQARDIAEKIVMPEIVSAVRSHVQEPYAKAIIDSTRTRGDRVPTVIIGKQKKALNRGASSNAIRFGSIKGAYKSRSKRMVTWPQNQVQLGWTKTASDNYLEPAFDAWKRQVEIIVAKFNSGSI